jgi:small subunit ribosomal protein S17e
LLNKVRRLAEDLVNRYPTLFSADFEKNKKALSDVSVIHARALRNQLAGAITKLMRERLPATTEAPNHEEEEAGATIEERVQLQTQARGAHESNDTKVRSNNEGARAEETNPKDEESMQESTAAMPG